MKCAQCGEKYSSKYYFSTRTICQKCYKKLPPEKQLELQEEVKEFAEPSKLTRYYVDYGEVPFYYKQWFFWLMWFTITPAAIGILLFGDVYYKKKGNVKTFGWANKVVAFIIGIPYFLFGIARFVAFIFEGVLK